VWSNDHRAVPSFVLSHDDDEKKQGNYLTKTIWALPVLGLVYWLWPETLPFRFLACWRIRGSLIEWLRVSWPIFCWGVTISALMLYRHRDHIRHAPVTVGAVFVSGAITSVLAGVMEEICFRWLIFLNAIVGAKIANFLFFGFAGFGITEWLQVHLVGPIANVVTFGAMGTFLGTPNAWAVGAGILGANAFFRDGHRYQGLFGIVNSWFAGMFLFWLMFRYGLLAAIVVHFTYDFLIDLVKTASFVAYRRPTSSPSYRW